MTPTLEQLRNDIESARKSFRASCRAILREAYEDADQLSSAIGTVSVDEASAAWVRHLIERLNQ